MKKTFALVIGMMFVTGDVCAQVVPQPVVVIPFQPPMTALPPDLDGQATYGARRLFRVGRCEVWGLTWEKQKFVVSVCQ